MADMKELRCSELTVADCDYVARGETTGDVLEDIIEHLDEEHDVELPDAEDIIDDAVDEDELDGEARVIVNRIQERMAIAEAGGAELSGSDLDVGVPVPPPQHE